MASQLTRATKKLFVTVGTSNSDYITDGVADEVQIQAAIDAVNTAGGGVVFIRAGTYTLAAEVSIKNRSNVTIQGEGVGVTVLMNYGIRKNDNTTTSNMGFRDFTIDINGQSHQAMAFTNNSYFFHMKRVELKNADSNFLLQWGACDRLIVENCYFYDGGLTVGKDNCAGGQLTSTNNTSIFRNNWFVKEFSAGGGLLTTGQTGNLLVEGNSFIDLSNNCYAAVSCEQQTGNSMNIQIMNNQAYRVGYQLGVSGNSNRIARGMIVGNTLVGVNGANTAVGIETQRVDDLLIDNNTLSDTSYGIFSSANGYVKITNNKIKNTDTASSGFPSDKAGIYLTSNTVVEVEDNIVWDDQGTGTTPYGLRIVGGSQRVYSRNNKMLGPFVTNALQVTSTQTYFSTRGDDFSGGSISLGTITNYENNGTLFTQTADKTVTNTVTETTILGTGVGSVTLPANFFVAGKTIRLRIGGIYSTPAASTPSLVIKVKYGSTVVATVTTSALVAGASSLEFDTGVDITCRSTGSSGTVMVHGDIEYATGAAGTVLVDPLNNAGATTTINTTTSNALDVTVTWDAATSTRSVKSTVCTVEVLN